MYPGGIRSHDPYVSSQAKMIPQCRPRPHGE
jgi:hypothetical protein